MSPVSDDFREKIIGAHAQLEEERRPTGTRAVAHFLRTERPLTLLASEEEALWDAGWRTVVGYVLRSVRSEGGERTILSVPGEEGPNYKQLSLIFLTDALGIVQAYESRVEGNRLQREGWWKITLRLREMPEGSSVADIFPDEERWDTFWRGIRSSDLWQDAA